MNYNNLIFFIWIDYLEKIRNMLVLRNFNQNKIVEVC